MTNRASFYITRALIGLFEEGFIPGMVNTVRTLKAKDSNESRARRSHPVLNILLHV
jgi:hypothetical protein